MSDRRNLPKVKDLDPNVDWIDPDAVVREFGDRWPVNYQGVVKALQRGQIKGRKVINPAGGPDRWLIDRAHVEDYVQRRFGPFQKGLFDF